MLIYGLTTTNPNLCKGIASPLALRVMKDYNYGIGIGKNKIIVRKVNAVKCSLKASLVAIAAAAVVSTAVAVAVAAEAPPEAETLSNIPQTLSGECAQPKDCKQGRIQRPKSRKAETCTSKCVTTCIQGGEGSPGLGPFNIRRPLVVFKEGFRSRRYCLVECSDICNLIGDGDDGP